MSELPAADVFLLVTDDSEVLKRNGDKKARPFSMLESTEPPPASLRRNQSSEDLARDTPVHALPPPACWRERLGGISWCCDWLK